jgi:hypothetical protein
MFGSALYMTFNTSMVYRAGTTSGVPLKRLALILAALSLAACRNVELPSAEALQQPGPGPQVSAPTLVEQKVVLNSSVTLNVQDVNAVASVQISCGSIPLMTWNAPPFVGFINFTPCTSVGTPSDAGTGLLDVELTVQAVDVQGNASTTHFNIQLDTGTPAVAIDAPARVQPGQPVAFVLTVDRDLRGLPTVRIGGVEAQVTALDAHTFHVVLGQLPPFGSDATDGGTASLAALEDLNRTYTISIDAVGGNGNSAHFEQALLVSRILWQANLPAALGDLGTFADPYPALSPTATPLGLTVLFGNSPWEPGWFLNDGTFVAAEELTGFFTFYEAIDSLGNAFVYYNPNAGSKIGSTVGYSTVAPPDPTNATPINISSIDGSPSIVGAALCSTVNANCSFGNYAVHCVDAAGDDVVSTYSDALTYASYTVASGNSLVQPNVGECDAGTATGRYGFVIGDPLSGTLSAGPFAFDAGSYTCNYTGGLDAYPVGDGRVAMIGNVFCDDGQGGQVNAMDGQLYDKTGDSLGAYFEASYPFGQVGGALPDGKLLTISTNLISTDLYAYAPDLTGAKVVATLPGHFSYPAAGNMGQGGPTRRNLVTQPNRVVLLTATDARHRAVVVLDQNAQPRWIYPSSDTVDPNDPTTEPLLVANPAGGPIYLVDSYNGKVTAFAP